MKQLLERIENMMGSARVDCYRLHHDKKHQHSNSKPCLALIEWEKTLFELKAAIDNWTEEPTPRKRLTDEDIIEVACYVNSFINGSALTFAREIEKRILEGV